jgi:hypothetical protein
MRVALSGPLFGVITAALILLFNIIFNITSNILILSLIVGEILFNTIGNDGAKYRRAKKEMLVCTS